MQGLHQGKPYFLPLGPGASTGKRAGFVSGSSVMNTLHQVEENLGGGTGNMKVWGWEVLTVTRKGTHGEWQGRSRLHRAPEAETRSGQAVARVQILP